MIHVIGIIREEGGRFRLSCPDFPDVAAEGDTLAAAVKRASDEIEARLRAAGGGTPYLRSIDALARETPDRMDEGIAVLVAVKAPAAPPQAAGEARPHDEGAGRQVPLSGRVAATEEPTERAKAKAEQK